MALIISGVTGGLDRRGVATIEVPVSVNTILEALRTPAATIAEQLSIGLPYRDRKIAQQQSGLYIATFNFEGSDGDIPDGAEPETFELDGSTSEDPIESHHDFEALVKKYPARFDDDGQFIGFDRRFPTSQTQAETNQGKNNGTKNPLFGAKGYLVGGAVWRRTSVYPALPPDLLRGLGKISQPRGPAPQLDRRRNWLKITARAAFRGNCWQIIEEWLSSADGGWNEDVYRPE